MRYVESHRRQTYRRIVENASLGLRQNGTKGISVVGLMKLAGLTHGGFYNHFGSRAELVGEAIAFAMDQMVARWKNLANKKANGERFEALIADYLSPRHRDNAKQGCALPALAADVARSGPSERRALASKLEEMIEVLAELIPDEAPQEARQIATGAIATMVGSIVLSRAVGTGKLSDSILETGRLTAEGRVRKPPRRAVEAIDCKKS
ncbi:TetR/AcrR family transcriptional regulator [Bradyrhizobium sp. CCBAU 11361]|uniref:TetR/AcrR family transcriptional regulator n=1 Tax=Bradyrhizobium sp. CCBAU 11361 TaxID=1630812 RepID=UPI002304E5E5|nr:TetR/AcrR family transcriptional regulator [Bradyrhizobium sp. CCBAU 11361]MDA9492727.1 TetR family transcriptional regulator [Bradyrhizobium sp. CCBAU 11361]